MWDFCVLWIGLAASTHAAKMCGNSANHRPWVLTQLLSLLSWYQKTALRMRGLRRGPAVALGEAKPLGRRLRPATPASFLSVGSGSAQFLTPLWMTVSACTEFSFSSGFLFLFLSFRFFFLLVFDVRVFIVFYCMVHIPFIYLLENSRGNALNFWWYLFW